MDGGYMVVTHGDEYSGVHSRAHMGALSYSLASYFTVHRAALLDLGLTQRAPLTPHSQDHSAAKRLPPLNPFPVLLPGMVMGSPERDISVPEPPPPGPAAQ